ncbi:ribonucleotide-diphosphate reductase subunit beta [Planctomonas sp. JC2975]|nr:ribonucleotide-diphosphate reductase subunit beta [Planctomonas sp. JC2975]NNC12831.1 ribonucleotide-diphosphate reductase subunit beta [Planctomonas sp. JC2975]
MSAAPEPEAELVDGYLVPVDPAEEMQCESCQ